MLCCIKKKNPHVWFNLNKYKKMQSHSINIPKEIKYVTLPADYWTLI